MLDVIFLLVFIFSCIFDGTLMVLGVTKLLNIEKFNYSLISDYSTFLFILAILFAIVFTLAFIQNFLRLGCSGGPTLRSTSISNLLKYSLKTLLSILSIAILLVLENKGNILLYIILFVIGLICLIVLGKLFHKFMSFIIKKIHKVE